MTACKYGDPTCPCQDGDQCHYEGRNRMNVPPEYVRAALAVSEAKVGRMEAFVRSCAHRIREDEVDYIQDHAREILHELGIEGGPGG